MCTHSCVAALFTSAKAWKQLRYFPASNVRNKPTSIAGNVSSSYGKEMGTKLRKEVEGAVRCSAGKALGIQARWPGFGAGNPREKGRTDS